MGIAQRMATGGWPTSDSYPWVPGTALTNAEFILDAGHSSSYSGSGTTWSNLVAAPASGAAQSAYNFTTSGLTFSGTAGNKDAAEKFVSAGSGYVYLGSNTTFAEDMHKQGGTYSIIMVMTFVYSGSGDAYYISCGGNPGVDLTYNISSGAGLSYRCVNTPGNNVCNNFVGTLPAVKDKPHFFGFCVNNDSSNLSASMAVNGSYSSTTFSNGSTYNSGSANATLRFMANTVGASNPASGSSVCLIAGFNRKLSQDELTICYNNLRTRWGI